MYVCSSHFPRVHLGENHANEFWYTMGSKSSEVTNESDATIRLAAIFLQNFLNQ